MTLNILMLPPEVVVGQQVVQVLAHESEDGRLAVELRPAGSKANSVPGNQISWRHFTVTELPEVLGWIEETAQQIAANMQRVEKQRLRRQGYRV